MVFHLVCLLCYSCLCFFCVWVLYFGLGLRLLIVFYGLWLVLLMVNLYGLPSVWSCFDGFVIWVDFGFVCVLVLFRCALRLMCGRLMRCLVCNGSYTLSCLLLTG